MNFNIDIAIVGAFLLLTLFVGLGHGQKVRNIKDYALGDRKFSTAALVATIVATWVSGGSFAFYMAETYTHGLYFIIAIIADALSFLIIAHFFVPKMQSFLGKLSVAEVMGDLYGKEIRVVTAITGFIGTIGALAIQFKIFSNILGYFFYIPTIYSTTISAIIVITYSTFGGIRSVTFTDAMQIITFSIVIPIIGFIIWQDIGEPQLITNLVNTNANFDISKLLDYTQAEFLGTLAIFVYFLVPGFSPATFQRISMSANIVQSKKSFILAGFYLLVIELLIAWIAILVLVKDASLEPYNILNYIIDNYTYYGFKGIIIISIMAMIMSTADSYISSAAVLFSHDFCRPLKLIKQDEELLISRIFCIIVGSIAIIMSLKVDSIFNLFILGYGPYMTVVTVPFMLSVLNFNISKGSVVCGMLFGILGSLVWKYFSIIEVDDTVLGMLFNLMAIFVREQMLYRKKNRQKNSIIKTISIIDFVKKFCQKTILILKKLLIKTKPKEEHYYPLLGICFFVSIFSIVYFTPYDIRLAHKNLIDGIYQSILIFATMFLTYPLWPQKIKLKKYINILWILGLFYNMVFIPSLLVILSDFDQINLMIFLINLLILTNLLDWRLSLISIMTGGFFSFKLYEYLYVPIVWNTQLKLFYMLTLVTGILFAFLKPKQEYHEDTEAKVDILKEEVGSLDIKLLRLQKQEGEYTKQIAHLNEAVTHYSERASDQAKEIERLAATAQKILNNVNHELRLPVGNVMNFSQMICEGLDKYTPDQLKDLSDEVYKNSTRLSTMILNMLDLATLDVKKVNLNKSTENFSELVRDRVKVCRNMYLQGKPIKFKLTIEPEILIPIDPNYIRQVVDNLTINAINFSEKGMIEVEVRRQGDKVVMMMRDEGIGIPKHELFDIFDPFRMGSNTATKAEGRGVGLALCKSAVEAHDGIITAESPEGKGAVFYVVLPRENRS